MALSEPLSDFSVAGRTTAPDPNLPRVSVARNIPFDVAGTFELDFTTVNQAQAFGVLRSMSADNTDNPSALNIDVSITGQTFTVPAYSQGMFLINAANNSKITIQSDGGTTTKSVSLAFYNYDNPPFVWSAVGTSPSGTNVAARGTMQAGDIIAASSDNQPLYIAGRDLTDDSLTGIAVMPDGTVKVNIADGADVTQGAKADAVWNGTTGNPTIVSILKAVWTRLIGSAAQEYEIVAASATDQTLGAAGASGDYLDSILVQPATNAPGNVIIKDGSTTVFTFPGGAASVVDLKPFSIFIKARSVNGAWNVTTGTNVSVVGIGDFT